MLNPSLVHITSFVYIHYLPLALIYKLSSHGDKLKYNMKLILIRPTVLDFINIIMKYLNIDDIFIIIEYREHVRSFF